MMFLFTFSKKRCILSKKWAAAVLSGDAAAAQGAKLPSLKQRSFERSADYDDARRRYF